MRKATYAKPAVIIQDIKRFKRRMKPVLILELLKWLKIELGEIATFSQGRFL
jgi:hypothetical protein